MRLSSCIVSMAAFQSSRPRRIGAGSPIVRALRVMLKCYSRVLHYSAVAADIKDIDEQPELNCPTDFFFVVSEKKELALFALSLSLAIHCSLWR